MEVWCPKADPTTGFIEIHSTLDETIEKFRSKEEFGNKRLPDGTWVFGWKSRWCCVVDIEGVGQIAPNITKFNRLVAISLNNKKYQRDYRSACKLAKEVEREGKIARIRRQSTGDILPAAIL